MEEYIKEDFAGICPAAGFSLGTGILMNWRLQLLSKTPESTMPGKALFCRIQSYLDNLERYPEKARRSFQQGPSPKSAPAEITNRIQ